MERTAVPDQRPGDGARPPLAGLTRSEPQMPVIPAHQSTDDPRVTLDRELGVFEPVPPYPPRTEREAEFYTLGDGEMFINMGPQHPSTHGVLRVVLKLDGEKVVDLDPVLGYLHRGVEKLCENADYHQAICYTDPLEYVSSLFNEWAPVLAFEKLLDVEVPRRAEYIRVLSSELNRVASHALFLGWMALDLGGLTPILWSFIERDEIVEMLAALTGQRMLFNYFRIGGVNGDLNHEFMSRLGDWMSKATEQIESGNAPPQRERDLRPPDARPGHDRHRDRPADGDDRPEPAGDRRAVRRPPGASVQRLPRARVRHPDPDRGRLPRPLPAAPRRDQAEPADHRPVPPPDARRPGAWPSCRGCCGRARAAPTPRSRARAASTRPTPSATAPTSRSGCGSTTRRSSTSSRSG